MSFGGDIDDLKNLRVQKEKFRTCINSIRLKVKDIWDNTLLDHYTKHDIDHSNRIIRYIDKILECGNCTLNEDERFILLAAAYLHDIGMQFPTYADLPRKNKDEYTREEKEMVREKHHEISAKVILESVKPNSKISLGLEECREIYPDLIATVSKYHRKLPLDSEELQDMPVETGKKVRLRLLAALLRLADALDQTRDRVNMESLRRWDIPPESKIHWYTHYYVQSVDIENGRINVCLTLPEKYNGNTKIVEYFKNKVKETIKRHLSEVYTILWNNGIKLYNLEKNPKIIIKYFTAIDLLPDELIKHIELTYEIANERELTVRTGVVWYIDGIPFSDNAKLVECLSKIFKFVEEENYLKAIEEVEKGNVLVMDPMDRITFSIIAGNVYYITGKLNDAERYYKDAIKFSEREDLKRIRGKAVLQARAVALGNIGLIYMAKGDLDKALEYLKKALEIHREINLQI